MKKNRMSFLSLAVLVAAVVCAVPGNAQNATQTETKTERKMFLKFDGQPIELNLNGIAEGESRTFTNNGKTVTVTRRGNLFTVNADGKELPPIPVSPAADSNARVMFFADVDGTSGQDQTFTRVIKLKSTTGDAPAITLTESISKEAKQVIVEANGATTKLNLTDLADGETRSFAAGGHTADVTRRGDKFEIKIDGKAAFEGPVMFRMGKVGDPAAQGEHDVMIMRNGPESTTSNIIIRKADGSGTKGDQVFAFINGDTSSLTVSVNGTSQVFSVQDLAEGETKSFTCGPHKIDVTRKNGDLQIAIDGKVMGRRQ